jgi:hypothetical protein
VSGTQLAITPEPTPDERAAIETAIAALLAEDVRPASAWWQAGVLEALEDDEPDAP